MAPSRYFEGTKQDIKTVLPLEIEKKFLRNPDKQLQLLQTIEQMNERVSQFKQL